MAAPTINGSSLGQVNQIASTKDGNIIPIAFPGEDSDVTDTFDLLGVTRIMNVQGTFTGADTAAVKTQVDVIEDLIDGNQENSVDFVTDQFGTLSVKIASFDVVWVVPSNHVTYVLKLVEGA